MPMVFDGDRTRFIPVGTIEVDAHEVTSTTTAMPAFEAAADMTQADIDDFSGSILTRTIAAVEDDADTADADESMPAITDTATVYTNQDDPTPMAFADVYELTIGGD